MCRVAVADAPTSFIMRETIPSKGFPRCSKLMYQIVLVTLLLGEDQWHQQLGGALAALNVDPWALGVTSRDVTCRGCTKIATVSMLEEYSPGCWIKHRNHCKGVKKQRSVELAASQAQHLKKSMQSPAPEPIYQVLSTHDTSKAPHGDKDLGVVGSKNHIKDIVGYKFHGTKGCFQNQIPIF
ncbi:hypothetical protein C8F04DRAFT_1183483 [Mycena alexandri]|uniref:Uncharacterized protein n=1 Tax=Mycena alexandri TaxID=1745969 RepID=A0AAD6SUS4_9AGAR|nr:hypothetical protein C8F04DRAFT_1183483 [Mycena alexandri]